MTIFFKGSKSICEAKSFRGIFQGSYFDSNDEVANVNLLYFLREIYVNLRKIT